MSTFARWREAAKNPFPKDKVVRMEDGKPYRPYLKKPRRVLVAKVKVARA